MSAIGMAWYTREGYERMRVIADDGADFDDTFEEFEARAEKLVARFEAQGLTVEKMLIDADEAARWCRENGFRLDQRGRAAFGAAMRAERGMAPL